MGRKSCLDTDVIQICIQIPTLFQGDLGKQHPGPSLVYEVEAVDPNLNRTGIGTRFQGRKHGYFQAALRQFILSERREPGIPKGRFYSHDADGFF
jgi:hypothetical protein